MKKVIITVVNGIPLDENAKSAHIILLQKSDGKFAILKNRYATPDLSISYTMDELMEFGQKFKTLVIKEFLEEGIITEEEAFLYGV